MQPLPRSVVAAKSHRTLQPKGTHSVLLFTNVPRRIEPRFQRKSCAVKQRAFHRALLTPTGGTMPKATCRNPRLCPTALRTNKPFRPPQFSQESHTGFIRGKLFVKLSTCLWKRLRHHLVFPESQALESSAYPVSLKHPRYPAKTVQMNSGASAC